jgi:hypothetical protein
MKTGTLSLREALRTLGYRALHNGGLEAMNRVQRAIAEGRPMLTYLDHRYDAFTDLFGVVYYFYLADVRYPGSKFILTVRDLDEWLESRRRHVEAEQRQVDLDLWAAEYTRHEAAVRAYFTDRHNDLLALDLVGGEGWEPLCEFLGRPVPEAPFPWMNRAEDRAPG